jgi:prevent-host-death family protein
LERESLQSPVSTVLHGNVLSAGICPVDNPNRKGNIAELAIAKEAASLGLSVLKPLTEHERYDLALGIGGSLLRVQCKWGALKGAVVCVRVSSCYHSPTRGYVKKTYAASEVDAAAVYCGELDRCFLLPVGLFGHRGVVNLRLEPARNNQRAALNWAADYEFRGAIAQLEERLTGSQEVVGSSPTSSTPHLAAEIDAALPGAATSDELAETVGMDEFYAKLARYVRRAEAGKKTLVTRWGRPVAKLGPIEDISIP